MEGRRLYTTKSNTKVGPACIALSYNTFCQSRDAFYDQIKKKFRLQVDILKVKKQHVFNGRSMSGTRNKDTLPFLISHLLCFRIILFFLYLTPSKFGTLPLFLPPAPFLCKTCTQS